MSNTRQKEILAAFIKEVWNEGNLAAVDKYIAAKDLH